MRALQHGFSVLRGAVEKGHGMREAHIIDAEGYCWVPSILL
jgi:hypothetical protein